MKQGQLPFLVEAGILLVAMILGAFLGRKAKPYGKVKLGFHLFFFLWFSMGYYFLMQILFTPRVWSGVGIAVAVMGLALVTQVVTGLILLLTKKPNKMLPILHGGSAVVLLIVDVTALFLAGIGT